MKDIRDFTQLKRTCEFDIARIAEAVLACQALNIKTEDVTAERDVLLPRMACFEARLLAGGEAEVTTDEAEIIREVFGSLWSLGETLKQRVSTFNHYQESKARFDHWEAKLPQRPKAVKYADGHDRNSLLDGYITYASTEPSTLLESCRRAWDDVFEAVRQGDLQTAHKKATEASAFATREHLFDNLVRRCVLVPVNESSC